MLSVGIGLAAHKITAVKLLLLGKAYVLFLRGEGLLQALPFFSPGSIPVLDTSFNCFFLALKAQSSSGVQVELQLRQEAREEALSV